MNNQQRVVPCQCQLRCSGNAFRDLGPAYVNNPRYILKNTSPDRDYELLVGCNECCEETVSSVCRRFQQGQIQSLVLCLENINKDPMMRQFLALTQTEYFATGGLWAARTAFLKEHDFPDPGMVKRADDLLLGELCEQHDGKLSGFPQDIMRCIKISDGQRRGTGESDDGWVFH